MNTDKTVALLMKPVWGYKEVQSYLGCGKEKAYKLIKLARSIGGVVSLREKQCTRDSFLSLYGTTADHELALIRGIIEPTKAPAQYRA